LAENQQNLGEPMVGHQREFDAPSELMAGRGCDSFSWCVIRSGHPWRRRGDVVSPGPFLILLGAGRFALDFLSQDLPCKTDHSYRHFGRGFKPQEDC